MHRLGATGKGAVLAGLRPWRDLYLLPDMASQDRDHQLLAHDLYFGNLPFAATPVPYTWLTPPATFRPDQPINTVTVTSDSGVSGYATDTTSVDEHGAWTPSGDLLLRTATPADPQNLADWLVAYYTRPRMRLYRLTLNLLSRSDDECRRILTREISDRITITDPPATWPSGATELVIEGVEHIVAADIRVVSWNTSPVIGAAAGVVGPWVRADQSTITGTDVWAY